MEINLSQVYIYDFVLNNDVEGVKDVLRNNKIIGR